MLWQPPISHENVGMAVSNDSCDQGNVHLVEPISWNRVKNTLTEFGSGLLHFFEGVLLLKI